MGLLDLFGGDNVKKWQKRLVQKYGPPENRAKAIEELAKIGTPEALFALLTRFDVLAEASIADKEEKERVYAVLKEAGANAVEPIQRFLLTGESVSWPLKALKELAPGEYVGAILAALERIGPGYVRDASKKLDLVKHLGEERDARIGPALVPFLEDPDDSVKIEAAEAIAAQRDPSTRDALIQLLLAHPEQPRVVAAAAAALAESGFDVKGHTPAVARALPPTYEVTREGKVRRK